MTNQLNQAGGDLDQIGQDDIDESISQIIVIPSNDIFDKTLIKCELCNEDINF